MFVRLFLLMAGLSVSVSSYSNTSEFNISLSGESGAYSYALGPDGEFGLMVTFDTKKNTTELQYVDFQSKKIKSLVKTGGNNTIDYLMSVDGKQIVVIVSGFFSLYVHSIDVLTVNSAGDVVKTDKVFEYSNGDTAVPKHNIDLTRNGDMIYVLERQNLDFQLIAHNLSANLSKVIFEAPSLRVQNAVPGTINNSAPHPMNNENFYFFSALCGQCQINGAYVVSSRDLTLRQLKIPLHSTKGWIKSLLPDETTNSPWVVIDECGDIYSRYAFNVDTSEEFLLYDGPRPTISCSWLAFDFAKVNGNYLALRKEWDSSIFNINSQKSILNGKFLAFSGNGTEALMGAGVGPFELVDLATGQKKPGFIAPPNLQEPTIMEVNLDNDFLLMIDVLPGIGSAQVPVWILWRDASQAPTLVGSIYGRPSTAKCFSSAIRQSIVCFTDEENAGNTIIHAWELSK